MKTKEDCAYCGTPLTTTGVYRDGKYFCWEGHAEAYEAIDAQLSATIANQRAEEIADGKFAAQREILDGVITMAAYPDQIRMEALKAAMAAGAKDTGHLIANAKAIEKYLRTGE